MIYNIFIWGHSLQICDVIHDPIQSIPFVDVQQILQVPICVIKLIFILITLSN